MPRYLLRGRKTQVFEKWVNVPTRLAAFRAAATVESFEGCDGWTERLEPIMNDLYEEESLNSIHVVVNGIEWPVMDGHPEVYAEPDKD